MTEAPSAAPEMGWQKLSPWAVGFIFIRVHVEFIRNNLPVLAGAGAGVALIERIGLREVSLAALIIVLAVALVCLVHYRRFRFRFDGDTLLVRRGIIERTELKVRAHRVQHIAIEQPLYLRLFGLVRFSVDTPGGAAAQVELPGIPAAVAEDLRTRLTRAAGDADAGTSATAPPAREEALFRASGRGVVLHGVASNHAWILAAALAPFLRQIEALIRWLTADTAVADWSQQLADHPVPVAVGGVLALVATLLAASVMIAWLRYHGFELSRADGRFRQRSGLLNRQEQSLSRARLQTIELVETAVGRLLGRSYLICRQIGAVLPGQENSGRAFLVPGLARADALRLVTELWPRMAIAAHVHRVHRYYIRAQIVRASAGGLLILGALAVLFTHPWWLAAAPVLPLVLWPFAWLRWRALGYHEGEGDLQIRRGLLGRRTTLFPLINVQRIDIGQSWFQRRRGVASLTFVLASGPVTLPCLAKTEADRLVNLTLYRVESAAPGCANLDLAQGQGA